MKRKLFCSILIAFGLFACNDNEIESPAARSAAEDPTTGMGPGNLEEENGTSSLKKTPITEEELDQIIANTPEGQPIVIERRSGSINVGRADVPPPGYHPDLLVFNFIDCDFKSIVIQRTTQQAMTLNRCTVERVTLITDAVVQNMELRRSRIGQMTTMDGSYVEGLAVINSEVSGIINDSGSPFGFQSIGFQ